MAAMSRKDKYRLILKMGVGRSGISNEGSMIMDAVRKQIPIKPRIETTKEVPHTHNYGRLLCFYCPTCGRNLVNIYETDPLRGGGVHRDLNGCMKCLQAIDFEEWKHKDKTDDDLEMED